VENKVRVFPESNILFCVCAGPLWPGVGLSSSVTILLGVCGVSMCASRSPGLVFSLSAG
jgi:hypothetical protein